MQISKSEYVGFLIEKRLILFHYFEKKSISVKDLAQYDNCWIHTDVGKVQLSIAGKLLRF